MGQTIELFKNLKSRNNEVNDRIFSLVEELEATKEKIELYRQDFDNADPEYIDYAIMKLNAEEHKLNIIIKEMKKLYDETISAKAVS